MEIDIYDLFKTTPALVVFLVIGFGYFLGKLNIGGFELGPTGGVLLIGLLFGHFGLELDATRLADEESAELASWIDLHKRFRALIHKSPLLRIDDRGETGRTGLGVVDDPAETALYGVYQISASPFRIPPPLRLPGLDPARSYRVSLAAPAPDGARLTTPALLAMAGDGLVLPGAAMTTIGLQLPALQPESALVLQIRSKDDQEPGLG